MKYTAKPLKVDAYVIVSVGANQDTFDLALDNGEDTTVSLATCRGITPLVGDYYFEDEKGHVYIEPKDVFERKYEKAAK